MSRPHLDTQNSQGHDDNPRYSFMETPLEMHPLSHIHFPASPPSDADSSSVPLPATEQPREFEQQSAQYFPNEKEQHLQQGGMIPTFSKYPPPDQHPAHFAPYAEPTQPQPDIQPVIQSPMQSPMQSPFHLSQYPQIAYQYQYQQTYQQPQQQTYQQMYQQTYQQQVYQQQHQQMCHQVHQEIPQETYSQPPSSPGPLPVKVNPDVPTRSDTMTVAPDVNPLQSPKLPYFSPTSAASSPAPAATAEDLSTFHQPGQIVHPNQEVLGGGWTHGMCDCSNNFAACFLGIFCPCILYGKTQYRLNRKSKGEDPTNMLGYESCNGACTGMALLCGCQCILTTLQRRTTRKAYGIHGDCGSDCVRSTCCCCCTLIQNEKEIQKREEHRNRAAIDRGATLSPYIAPGPMTYPPPPK